jgi:hypothetical protein
VRTNRRPEPAAALRLSVLIAAAIGTVVLTDPAGARTSDAEADLSNFDLGIDISDVVATGPDPVAVRDFLAAMEPVSRQIILTTCSHYLTTPRSAQWRGTKRFSAVALEVWPVGRAFSTTRPGYDR